MNLLNRNRYEILVYNLRFHQCQKSRRQGKSIKHYILRTLDETQRSQAIPENKRERGEGEREKHERNRNENGRQMRGDTCVRSTGEEHRKTVGALKKLPSRAIKIQKQTGFIT